MVDVGGDGAAVGAERVLVEVAVADVAPFGCPVDVVSGAVDAAVVGAGVHGGSGRARWRGWGSGVRGRRGSALAGGDGELVGLGDGERGAGDGLGAEVDVGDELVGGGCAAARLVVDAVLEVDGAAGDGLGDVVGVPLDGEPGDDGEGAGGERPAAGGVAAAAGFVGAEIGPEGVGGLAGRVGAGGEEEFDGVAVEADVAGSDVQQPVRIPLRRSDTSSPPFYFGVAIWPQIRAIFDAPLSHETVTSPPNVTGRPLAVSHQNRRRSVAAEPVFL